MTLLIDVDGRSLSPLEWARDELPQQLLHVDDVDGLCVLARLLVEHDLVAHAAPLLARLRPLAAENVAAAVAVAAVVDALAASAAARADERRGDVSGVPSRPPLWGAVLKDAASLVPPLRPGAARVVVFALADEHGADPALLQGHVGPQTTTARLARGITLLLAEQLQARLPVDVVAVVPVVGDAGFFVATRAWDLLAVLPLLPSPPPRLLIVGSRRPGKEGSRIVLDVHDLEGAGDPRHVDAPVSEIAAALLRVVAELLDVQKTAHGPLTPRSLDDDVAGAAADLHALLLAATGRVDPAQLYNDEAAFDALCALPPTQSSTLMLLSAVVCSLSCHRVVPARALDVVDAGLSRHAVILAPVLDRARALIAAAR
ncbi:MAG: hypothetical protein Q8O67_15155 [Deltaproteobacteria bacterium]|nr:hypothetical protein [Deltaproteobacteria bacterium]